MSFGWQTPEQYVETWMLGKNPSFRRVMEGWNGDPEDVRPMLEKVIREEFQDLNVLGAYAGVAAGKKPG